ncbi:MAG: hypothetical protein ACLFUC_02670 [Bacteroidales bacterium]
MPYRRLPNTDSSRLKALKIACQKGKEIPPFKLAYTQSTFQQVQSFLSGFEKVLSEHRHSYNNQVKKNKEYLHLQKKARIYISHFIQVMNMAIQRGELSPSTRHYYGLEEDDKRLPSFSSETDIITWGDRIIRGETERKMKGMSPVTNPTIAVVKVHYDNFMDSYTYQKTLQKNNARKLEELAGMREKCDEIIVNVWNEVENTFRDLPDDIKREKASEYGVIYVFRKNEIVNLQLFDSLKLDVDD